MARKSRNRLKPGRRNRGGRGMQREGREKARDKEEQRGVVRRQSEKLRKRKSGNCKGIGVEKERRLDKAKGGREKSTHRRKGGGGKKK